jgi:DNA-binding XRE family transcriptional regulator
MSEIAELMSVSRQTLYNWKDGEPTNSLIANRASKMLNVLKKAVRLGYLPIKADIPKHLRIGKIKQALGYAIKK